MMEPKKVVIMGAAGRDFHNFNVYYRNNPDYKVVAFTATQIPDIHGRKYPAELAGNLYPDGIPIYSENELEKIIKEDKVDEVVFAYSDVSHNYVMHTASRTQSVGANFILLGPNSTMIKSEKPVVSVCAVRTGSGKSQTSRRVSKILIESGKKVVVIRHPMPYGDLVKQRCQRFENYDDLDRYECTFEEREEYEPHIESKIVVYAGVDYEEILRKAEKEAEIILWDGGNNDFPFYFPDLHIVVADPHRPGHELLYHPGETNLRMADVVVINKIDTAAADKIINVQENIKSVNPKAKVVFAESPISIDRPELIRNKRALVIEDGPTLTHGEMSFGAGFIAAQRAEASEIIDPRPYAVGSIKDIYKKYTHLEKILPAMGYSDEQIKELEQTIINSPCEVVVVGTPINLLKLIKINKPAVRVKYELKDVGTPNLKQII
ncbi:MAG: cyclic 2,3-diphosphoglycerate synthase, partial [Actinobacteria bacterium]|nr:cyclic 2,3-diphosphoglycerate synthase [Actinomycetota bacterium]